MLGTKALQIFDETTCVVRAVRLDAVLRPHESCGKCTPCREGTYWLAQIYERPKRAEAQAADLDKAARHLRRHPRQVVLRLGDGAASPIISSLKWFRDSTKPTWRRLPVRPYAATLGFARKGGRMTLASRRKPVPRPENDRQAPMTADGAPGRATGRWSPHHRRPTRCPVPKGHLGDSRGRG